MLLHSGLVASLQTYGYILVFGLTVIEGPIVVIIAAFLASQGIFDIYVIAILGWLGDVVGDMLFFFAGRFGFSWRKKQMQKSKKVKKWFLASLDEKIHKNLLFSLWIIKFTPYAPPIGLTYLGQTKIPTTKYILTSLVSCIPTPVIAVLLGYNLIIVKTFFENHHPWWLEYLLVGGVFLCIVLCIFWFLRRRRKKSCSITNEDLK